MRCSRKFLTLIACTALGLPAVAADKKDKPKEDAKASATKKKSKTPKAEPTPAAKPPTDAPPTTEESAKPLPKLSLPLPKGQDSKGVVIPYTDATGKKSMLFRIGIGTRLDEDQVKMADLMIETFDENGKQEMTIELPHSRMNLATRTITGDQRVTIKRSDFQITGQTMEFNTETKQGWIKGDVKMIIYDLSDETGDKAPKKKEQGS